MVRLGHKVAIITGGGSGIGRETALLFAREGATVVVADLNEEAGQETVAMIGKDALFVRTDVSDWKDVSRLVSETVSRFGRLDILFNNAGIGLSWGKTVVETPEAHWDKMMAVNLKSVFLGARHALPVMMAQRAGVIVNTASRAGIAPGPRMASYCTSKAGVISLTRQLAVDYAPYNIRVNCICPGAMEKPMGQAGTEQLSEAARHQRAALLRNIPLGRFCPTGDIAHAALYLASDEAAFVTGVALVVDGGNLAL